MKKVIATALILTLLFFLIPLILPGPDRVDEGKGTGEPGESEGSYQGDWKELAGDQTLRVLLNGEVREMPINEYIWGVTAAEMPASFELEALKAQAVAARTYALRRAAVPNQNHPDADVCGDYTCCQAYISPEQAAANWGDNAEVYTAKITRAVADTGLEVIRYQGALIDAVFHSSSAGSTQDAVAVWGSSVPYLVSVNSPEGEEVPNFHSQVSLSAEEFRSAFLAAHAQANLGDDPKWWIGETVRNESGSVEQINIGGVLLRGSDVRSLYKLRSANFTVEAKGDQIVFQVAGYGHGVGMSQYGANTMATQGKGYRDILSWYYTGVTIETYTGR
ncbi:MAG: stage sporulation protein [Firmicutes bacterium]|nr:stage sporulation protein [Bacillota bacterium]